MNRNEAASLLPSERDNAMPWVWTWKRPNYLLVGAVVGTVALLGVGTGHGTGGPYKRAVALLNDYPLIDGYACMYCMRVWLCLGLQTGTAINSKTSVILQKSTYITAKFRNKGISLGTPFPQWRSKGGSGRARVPGQSTMQVRPAHVTLFTRSTHERLAYSRCRANTNDLATPLPFPNFYFLFVFFCSR